MNIAIHTIGVTQMTARLATASSRVEATSREFMTAAGHLLAYAVQEKEPIGLTRELHDTTQAVDYGSVQVVTTSVAYDSFIETGERSDPRVAGGTVYRGGGGSMAQRHFQGRQRKNRLGRFIAQSGGVWMFKRTAEEFNSIIGPAGREFLARIVQEITGG